ncbi:MAG: ornithine cyclodeaminase family protein [Mycolicibacterium sp.]|uniref:ornithine cyclodeaminase family protein n=1 Tax=Mycolicibacterium sp. TaxID=2320850 RepID=UPI003D1265BC
MSDTQMLVCNRADLEGLGLTWAEIIDVLDDAFGQKARGLVQNPPKPKVTSREDAFIHAMPAYLGGSDRIGIKWVAGYEQNHTKGLPYIYGAVIMNDADTGRPIALLDGGWITEMRTPGVSGVTMRHVPGDPKRLALVGCGVQGRRHLEVALEVHPGLTHVTAYDYVDGVARRLLDNAGDRVTNVADTPSDAVAGADLVITTITVPLDPKLDCANTHPDALLLPVDYDDAMAPAAFEDAVVYCVDDLGQYGSVAGSLYFFGLPRPNTHLAAVVAGEYQVPVTGRRMFLNMGIAMDDIALGSLVLDRAVAAGAGRYIEFP